MKKILVIPLLLVFTGCFSSQVYLPHTSRVFHKKKCIALNDPSPIAYQSAQQAMSTGGVSPCSVCITARDFKAKGQGYTSTNYSTMPSNLQPSSTSALAPSSVGSSALKVLKAAGESWEDVHRNSQPPDYSGIYAADQMRRQTNIMQQQLDLQRKAQRPQPHYFTPIQPAPSVTNIYNTTPEDDKQWQPNQSQFDVFKGRRGLLDK